MLGVYQTETSSKAQASGQRSLKRPSPGVKRPCQKYLPSHTKRGFTNTLIMDKIISQSRDEVTKAEMGWSIKSAQAPSIGAGQIKQVRGISDENNSHKHSAKNIESQKQASRQNRPIAQQGESACRQGQAPDDDVFRERQQLSADGPIGRHQRDKYRSENT